jgi:hypothetical protein
MVYGVVANVTYWQGRGDDLGVEEFHAGSYPVLTVACLFWRCGFPDERAACVAAAPGESNAPLATHEKRRQVNTLVAAKHAIAKELPPKAAGAIYLPYVANLIRMNWLRHVSVPAWRAYGLARQAGSIISWTDPRLYWVNTGTAVRRILRRPMRGSFPC